MGCVLDDLDLLWGEFVEFVDQCVWAERRKPAAPGLDGGRAGFRGLVGVGAVAAPGVFGYV
jgi:hypothetical protein